MSTALPIADPAALERRYLTSAKSALRAGLALKPSAGSVEREDLLVLALSNVRTAAVCLDAARRAASDSEHGGARLNRSEPLEPGLSAIVERSVEDDIKAGLGRIRDDLEQLLAHSQRLLVELEEPARQARRARRRQWVRALAPMLTLTVVLVFIGWRHFRARELAAGKPWTTSSVAAVCDPVQKLCGGAKTGILFHTQEQAEPWFEIDLGAEHDLTRIEVQNRSDCCPERAVPLIVEISSDHQHYRMVARKFTTFEQWSQSFRATRGRYVRLRVARRSVLHLERVQIYGSPW